MRDQQPFPVQWSSPYRIRSASVLGDGGQNEALGKTGSKGGRREWYLYFIFSVVEAD